MSNRLSLEASPYLRQHADNPVDWYPWGEEAFAQARDRNVPIHLSVGYAACHWCHVMAHESFEDPQIAALMNERFVNIKVDRQERPDVDEVYQKVIQMMGQSGGWPLTVFLTPRREPFFAGTYFPPQDRYGRPGFAHVLVALSDAWSRQDGNLLLNVDQFLRGFAELDRMVLEGEVAPDVDLPLEAARALAQHTDPVHGGLKGAPKFPNPSSLDLMLRVHARTGDAALLDAVRLTLDRMGAGGIYDHLGGGFARYSVDERWAVPHFEKMLYDNGQLVRLYADGFRLTGQPSWRRIFEQTIEYVLRDLSHPQGGFFASEDADSEGEEGRFYVWTPAQVNAALGPQDGAFACRALGITEQGNFEGGRSVPHRAIELDQGDEVRLDALRARLFSERARRVRPSRDENVITSWNALMIEGLCAAYQATGTDRYLHAARTAADFLMTQATMPDGGVVRAWRDGSGRVGGFLDDYAMLANALLDLYESCFDAAYLGRAGELADRILSKFWDDGLYFTPADAEALVHRPRAPYDHAWPSGTSSAAFALFRLYELSGKTIYRERAEQVVRELGPAAARNAFGFSHLLAAVDFARQGPATIIFAGPRPGVQPLAQAIQRI
ncbi:MAG TPA: thioredoxin domain-containing protein, partial [Burkholderiaceae bacterium]|nr:thioredoxin domain-containing protein [Burkholderiaceae bacterium]